uniref:Uncharacterized protein n=1 Tax=Cacopsylla melanoneura TaxID=428564 RepID=A0A8D9E3Z4_9HEMI
MTKEIQKLGTENKHLQSQIRTKQLLNETILTTSEEHEIEDSEYKKQTDEKLKQLSLTLQSKERQLQIATDENVALKLEIQHLESRIRQFASQPGTSDKPTSKPEQSVPQHSTAVTTAEVIDLEKTANEEQPSDQMTQEPVNLNRENRSNSDSIKCNRLFVIGDSHTRQLQPILHKAVIPKYSAKTVCLPGKKLKEIVNSIKIDKLTTNSFICVVAGTNDVFQTSWNDIQTSLDNLYVKCKDFQVMLVLAFPRYDVKKINSHIIRMNVKIKHYIGKYKNMTVLDPHNFINLRHMGNDLFHMDPKGKHILCTKTINKVFGIYIS